MHPSNVSNALSVHVCRNWTADVWELRWYVITPTGQLLEDGHEDLPAGMCDAFELEVRVMGLTERLRSEWSAL